MSIIVKVACKIARLGHIATGNFNQKFQVGPNNLIVTDDNVDDPFWTE